MYNKSDIRENSTEPIDLGRRIGEIIEEKNLSPYAFSQRIGMGKDTLYSCIRGERYIKPSELEVMAKVLRLSVERIKRQDTRKQELELQKLVESKVNYHRALELAEELLQTALGSTEKFEILNRLGAVYYYQKQMKKSKKTWLEALPHAQRIKEHYNEIAPLCNVTTNLISAFNALKDYAGLTYLLEELEPEFDETDPEYTGALCFSFAISSYHAGNLEQVEEKLQRSLYYYRQTGSTVLIGKGIHNLAYHQYLTGNYFTAKQFFEEAIATLEHHAEARLISVKDYIKVMVKLNERQTAVDLALKALDEAKELNLSKLLGKFLVLLAVLKNDTEYAKAVLELEGAGDEQKQLALKFLMDYCSRVDDAVGLMKYYKIAGQYLNKSTIFDWEGFIK